ncbi:hypothetical protein [Achromobacter aloeverae]|uniref:Uncharacterized protein n=1 Tax=Achromobacter aloeverae TaxID=1750518 RepID=A0A4Q1HIG0_9BURK|nr:hypothetical protein [Achromobacter aloeverae]RXN88004.1 hypothetical protein C7R54_15625 [Achromobacter aloeverae]
MTSIAIKPHRNGPECKSRIDVHNAIDVKRAAAAKLRDKGYKLPTSVKLQTILTLIEAETGWPIPEDSFTYMLRFIDEKPPEAAGKRDINAMQRRPIQFSGQLRQAAERCAAHPKPICMGSSVIVYRELDHIGY